MSRLRIRALAVLIGTALAAAAFVALPATAYAAADIDLNTLGGASEDHTSDTDPWSYETATETLTLLGPTSEYNLSGTNTSITIMVPSSASNASVNFYNVAAHPSLVNKSAFVAEGSCSLFIYGDSSLSSNEADTIRIGSGATLIISSPNDDELNVTCTYSGGHGIGISDSSGLIVQGNVVLNVTGSTISGSSGISCGSSSTITVFPGATLSADGQYGLYSANSVTLTVNGEATFESIAGVGNGISVSSLLLNGSGTVKAFGASMSEAVSLAGIGTIAMGEDITFEYTNNSSIPESHTFLVSNALSTKVWDLSGDASLTSGNASDMQVVITMSAGGTGTVKRVAAALSPVCEIWRGGSLYDEYTSLADALDDVVSGDRILLLDSISEPALTGISVDSGDTLAIDTDGYNLYIPNATVEVKGSLALDGNGDLTVKHFDVTGVFNKSAASTTTITDGSLSVGGVDAVALVNGDLISLVGSGVNAYDAASVTINGDIDAYAIGVSANGDGTEVTVNGSIESGSDGVFATSDADVEVTGNIKANGGDGVAAHTNATVTVGGDIVASANGVFADGNDDYVEVIVRGDISAGEDGVVAQYGAEVTVEGGIESNGHGVRAREAVVDVSGSIDAGTSGVTATEGSYVTVGGDIEADNYGVDASDPGTEVYIDGDIAAGSDGVHARNSCYVMVGGDIESDRIGVFAEGDDTEVYVDGSITADSNGITADDSSIVTVDGDIESGNNGVYAHKDAMVTVGGDISAEVYGVYADGGDDHAVVVVKGNIAAGEDGVYAQYGADVTVEGDIEAEGDGIYADEAVVDAQGDITAGHDGVFAKKGSQVTVGGSIEAGQTGVNADGGDDCVEVIVTGDITADGTGVYAVYGADVTVSGKIEAGGIGISASDGTVRVVGDIAADGDGIVAVNDSEVTVSGSVVSGFAGIFANNSVVRLAGDLTAGTDALGISMVAENGSDVSIGGNAATEGRIGALDLGTTLSIAGNLTISGAQEGAYAIDQAVLVIGGNLSATNLDDGWFALYSESGAKAWVKGDVVSNKNGVWAFTGGEATIDGKIIAPNIYVALGNAEYGEPELGLTAADFTSPTTKDGYLTYTDSVSSVWVAELAGPGPTNPPTTPPTGDVAGLLLWLGTLSLLLGVGLVISRRRFTLG